MSDKEIQIGKEFLCLFLAYNNGIEYAYKCRNLNYKYLNLKLASIMRLLVGILKIYSRRFNSR